MSFVPYTGDFSTEQWGVLTGQTFVQGAIVRFDVGTGFLEPAAEASAVKFGICASAGFVSSLTSGVEKIDVIPFREGQVWIVDTTGDLTQVMMGKIAALTDNVTMNEDEYTTRPLFVIIGYIGALTARKALVRPKMALITGVGV